MKNKSSTLILLLASIVVSAGFGFTGEINTAIEIGDLEEVKKMLKMNPDLAITPDDKGNLPVRAAIFGEHDDITKLIISNMTDVDMPNSRGHNALIYASYTGKLGIAKFLIAKGANVNYQDSIGMTPAHYAVQRNDKDLLNLLIESNANLHFKNSDGKSPVYLAFMEEKGEVLDVLAANDSIKPIDLSEKITFLHQAARLGKSKIVNKLSSEDVIRSRDMIQRTLLHNAAAGGLLEVVEYLHSEKMKVNSYDIYGSTPLHEAVSNGNVKIVEFLLSKGADINSKRPDGSTAVHIAKESESFEVVRLLLAKGAIDSDPGSDFPVLTGPYLGQEPPGIAAKLFAPGIVSKADAAERVSCLFQDNTLFIIDSHPKNFSGDWTQKPFLLSEYKNKRWTRPHDSKVTGKPWFHNLPSVPVGKQYIFAWSENIDGSGTGLYLWTTKKTTGGWSKPERFPPPINTGFDTWPTMSDSGTVYFHSGREGGYGSADIWLSKPVKGEYTSVENAGTPINSIFGEHDAFISKDESYILWSSYRPGGFGEDDIYVAFKKSDGTWSEAVNLGEGVNSPFSENRVYVTPDEKYIFYTSTKHGLLDVFWVDAETLVGAKAHKLTKR